MMRGVANRTTGNSLTGTFCSHPVTPCCLVVACALLHPKILLFNVECNNEPPTSRTGAALGSSQQHLALLLLGQFVLSSAGTAESQQSKPSLEAANSSKHRTVPGNLSVSRLPSICGLGTVTSTTPTVADNPPCTPMH
jgi:hypothetical protein